jgi:PPOX class probable F420-dependent enzyme
MITIPETHRDLLNADTGILATLGKNGFPQVTALWFLYDDDGMVRLSLNTTRQKVKNLQVHPECSFFILDRAKPGRTLEIRARAEMKPDADYVFADKVGKKYGGMDFRKIDKPGQSRVVVTLKPLKVNIHS